MPMPNPIPPPSAFNGQVFFALWKGPEVLAEKKLGWFEPAENRLTFDFLGEWDLRLSGHAFLVFKKHEVWNVIHEIHTSMFPQAYM